MLDLLFDPTFWFATLVMLVPLSKCDTTNQIVAYITQSTFISPFVLFFLAKLVVGWTKPKTVSLSSRDMRVANWFLCNAVFFNLFLDVIAGQFQSMGEMSVQYLKVEPRYLPGLYSDSGSVVFMTSMLELFFQSPLCFLAYYSYVHKKFYRTAVEIIVCVLHTTGVWYFYVPEVLRGYPHVLADHNFTFSQDHLLYYWFGFWIASSIWVFVPYFIAKTAISNIIEAFKYQEKSALQKKSF